MQFNRGFIGAIFNNRQKTVTLAFGRWNPDRSRKLRCMSKPKMCWVAAALIVLPVLAAAADETAQLDGVLALIERNQMLLRTRETCPADLYRSQATLFSLLQTTNGPDMSTCRSDLKFCHDSCVFGKNDTACFSLARALQEYGAPAADKHYEPLFALACAIGRPSGCTNRAAGIRNGGYANEPFAAFSDEARGLCLRRSFKIACEGDDAWGCAMYGQSLYDGEGGEEDIAAAASAFKKSCAFDEEAPSCEFSKQFLDAMTQALNPK